MRSGCLLYLLVPALPLFTQENFKNCSFDDSYLLHFSFLFKPSCKRRISLSYILLVNHNYLRRLIKKMYKPRLFPEDFD